MGGKAAPLLLLLLPRLLPLLLLPPPPLLLVLSALALPAWCLPGLALLELLLLVLVCLLLRACAAIWRCETCICRLITSWRDTGARTQHFQTPQWLHPLAAVFVPSAALSCVMPLSCRMRCCTQCSQHELEKRRQGSTALV